MADAAHPDSHEHGEHSPHLAHHFDTPVQQFDSGKLGMWVFLATEILFFSGLFCAYAVYRSNHPEVFIAGHEHLNKNLGAVNTIVLILSSFTMALGVYCAQTSRRTGLIICLMLTLLGAFGFMGIKYVEYRDKWRHGLLWGVHYQPTEHASAHDADAHSGAPDKSAAATGAGDHSAPLAVPAQTAGGPAAEHAPADPGAAPPADTASTAASGPKIEKSTIAPAARSPAGLAVLPEDLASTGSTHSAESEQAKNVHLFFGIYFTMTGLHGLHVLAGIVVIFALLINAFKGRYNSEYYTPVDLVGLYWHLVDLVWIFLFPLLYLIH